MNITDEMVEKAHEATRAELGGVWPSSVVRCILEAVAPALIAQGIREAIRLSGEGWTIGYIIDQAKAHELRTMADKVYNQDADIAGAILARAQELDPK